MNSELIENLRIAANQFYLNKYQEVPLMDDIEYDNLVSEYETEGRSVKDLVEWDQAEKVKNELPISLDKEAVGDNDLRGAVDRYLDSHVKSGNYYCNLKYDGCAIIGIYEDGKLKQVRSTPDEDFGIIRTRSFWNIFPHTITDKSIVALQGEALVDFTAYGEKARNKANGLVNSIYKSEEVENEIFVRIFRVYYNDENSYNFERSNRTLLSLPKVRVMRTRNGELHNDLVFSAALPFSSCQCPTSSLVNSEEGNFQCDGVVVYSPEGIKGYKFYFTESAVATVEKVEWNLQSNGSYVPKIIISPITLNDKNIGQVSSGGVPNLIGNKMGKGAKVRVILANMTIPKIIEVVEPSEEYQFPTCECGHEFSESDTYGASLKCPEEDCSMKLRMWNPYLIERFDGWRKDLNTDSNEVVFASDNFFDILDISLRIDRWSSRRMCVVSGNELDALLLELIKSFQDSDSTRFEELIKKHFRMSDLSMSIFSINAPTAWIMLKQLITN